MFFALAGAMELFHYLSYGVAAILAFVGVKMMISEIYEIPIPIALGVVGGLLLLSIAASLIWPLKEKGIPALENPAQEEDARKNR
jgi:tellurite resistance protein TerC